MTEEEKPKIQGTVKWFSNKKGYGFITPDEGSPTTTDVFVHQSSIYCTGYRTLYEGWTVEFTIGDDDGGRVKAENVTAPGGGPCTGPHRGHRGPRHRSKRGEGEDHEEGDHSHTDEEGEHTHTDEEGEGEHHDDDHGKEGGQHHRRRGRDRRTNHKGGSTQPEAFWHSVLIPEVKSALEAKNIRATTGTIDVSVGPARVKLGTGGYSSIAHADGVLAEGSFVCDAEGNATLMWNKCLHYADGEWKKKEDEKDYGLVTKLSLTDDIVVAVKPDETAQTLWGDKPDPREALEANGFLMRRVVLTPRQGRNRK